MRMRVKRMVLLMHSIHRKKSLNFFSILIEYQPLVILVSLICAVEKKKRTGRCNERMSERRRERERERGREKRRGEREERKEKARSWRERRYDDGDNIGGDNDNGDDDKTAGEHAAAGDTARIGRNPGRLPHPP